MKIIFFEDSRSRVFCNVLFTRFFKARSIFSLCPSVLVRFFKIRTMLFQWTKNWLYWAFNASSLIGDGSLIQTHPIPIEKFVHIGFFRKHFILNVGCFYARDQTNNDAVSQYDLSVSLSVISATMESVRHICPCWSTIFACLCHFLFSPNILRDFVCLSLTFWLCPILLLMGQLCLLKVQYSVVPSLFLNIHVNRTVKCIGPCF